MTKNIISIAVIVAIAAGYFKLRQIDQQKIEDCALLSKHAQFATSAIMEVINPILVNGKINPITTQKQALSGIEKISVIKNDLAKSDKFHDRDTIVHGELYFQSSAHILTLLRDFSEKLASNQSVKDQAILICESQKFNNEARWKATGLDTNSVVSDNNQEQLCSVVTKIALKNPAEPEPKFDPFKEN